MIIFHSHQSDVEVTKLVKLGFIRSYTKAQVYNYSQKVNNSCVHVFVNPKDSDLDAIQRLSLEPSKVIVLGDLPISVAGFLGLEIEKLPEDASLWDHCEAASKYGFSESSARISYDNISAGLECPIADRPLLRYDFANEWNNLGYGHVRTDGSMWSLACKAKSFSPDVTLLASVYRADEFQTIYASLSSLNNSEVLWVNRPVGFVDTHEFRLLETFITNFKSDTMPCLPLVREIPYGYDAMISMRLDCDEDIGSARPLFELYMSHDIPFTLAIRTGQPIEENDVELINEIIDCDGGILSHSVNHKCNWGTDFDDARREAVESRHEILSLSEILDDVEYAVSPFHQNPDYAVKALYAADYKGFIGGIICNDPQYLISRGGKIVDAIDIISHSQQCMLHGDCLLKSVSDMLVVFKQSVNYAVNSGASFGYLDHPFSDRYQYGWDSEEQRLSVHLDWIKYLKALGKVIFENEVNLLEHIRKKSQTLIWLDGSIVKSKVESDITGYPLAYEYKGAVHRVTQ